MATEPPGIVVDAVALSASESGSLTLILKVNVFWATMDLGWD